MTPAEARVWLGRIPQSQLSSGECAAIDTIIGLIDGREALVEEVIAAIKAYDAQDPTVGYGARVIAALRNLARWKP